jgi:GR25 family glycosyltransferase involved in LPS biosynthesis
MKVFSRKIQAITLLLATTASLLFTIKTHYEASRSIDAYIGNLRHSHMAPHDLYAAEDEPVATTAPSVKLRKEGDNVSLRSGSDVDVAPDHSSSSAPRNHDNVTLRKEADNLGNLPSESDVAPVRSEQAPKKGDEIMTIFFINLDKSTDRAESLRKEVNALPEALTSNLELQRVSAVSTSQVETMLENNELRFNEGITLAYSERQLNRKNAPGGTYTFNEAACTLSHLKAILQAYNAGHDMVLIIEDDAILTSDFLENWKAYAEEAPSDWQVLQWTTNNEAVNKRELHRRKDYWISWKPYYWGTMAYTIRRDGMKRILDLTSSTATTTRGSLSSKIEIDQWEFLKPDILVADEVVYSYAQSVYTSTFPWITTREVATTMGEYHVGNAIRDLTYGRSDIIPKVIPAKSNNEVVTKRPERIAIVVNYRLADEASVAEEIHRLRMDIEATSNLHHHWFINVVLAHKELLTLFDEKKSDLPSTMVEMRVQINDKRFNKFSYVKDILNQLTEYDYVLLKDNDIPLAGLEWNTFLDKKADSIIAGPFRETKESGLLRSRELRYSNSLNLQSGAVLNQYGSDSFKNTTKIPTMFLEMFFVLLRADFASWFFAQVFMGEFLDQTTDWGPDLMWCGAAHTFNHIQGNVSSSPCSLISINALDKDTRQIARTDGYFRQGHRAVAILQSNPLFSSWINANPLSPSYSYRGLSRECKKFLGLGNVRVTPNLLGKCGIAMAEAAVLRVEGSSYSKE